MLASMLGAQVSKLVLGVHVLDGDFAITWAVAPVSWSYSLVCNRDVYELNQPGQGTLVLIASLMPSSPYKQQRGYRSGSSTQDKWQHPWWNDNASCSHRSAIVSYGRFSDVTARVPSHESHHRSSNGVANLHAKAINHILRVVLWSLVMFSFSVKFIPRTIDTSPMTAISNQFISLLLGYWATAC